MAGETPLLETLAEMTAASVARAELDDRSLMLVRLAGLVAVGAPGTSYLLNLGVAAESGLTLEDVQGVLVALAPIVGGPKALSAAQTITDALGFALAVAIAEAAEE
jgi:hypothetical protein